MDNTYIVTKQYAIGQNGFPAPVPESEELGNIINKLLQQVEDLKCCGNCDIWENEKENDKCEQHFRVMSRLDVCPNWKRPANIPLRRWREVPK